MATAAEPARTVVEPAPFGADPARSVRASITQASVERAFAILLAMAAVGLGIVDAPAVLEQLPYLDPFWGPAVTLALAASFVFVGVSAFVQRVAQMAQIVCALLFLVAIVTWPATVQEPIPSSQQPWPWWFCTVGCTAAAMGFATWRATVYTALVPAVYVVVRLSPVGGGVGVLPALLDGVYTALLSGAVLVIAVVLRRAATAVDTAQSTAVRRYSLAIREHATEVERVQVDAIVLTTLLSAARADTLEAKTLAARMARNAIDHLEAAATDGPGEVAPVTLGELRARIREGVGALTAPVRLVPTPTGSVRLPASVADALASAALQAAVNSVQHAGDGEVSRWVRIEQQGQGVLVEVGDDGRGFDVAAIPAERLGVRRSIVERVATVDGRAEVHTAPGEGTRIVLTWSPVARATA
ncbi:sensor histidine kinase [Curtobacterium aurantiacum]|uniref:sensor histidine kinase n=1 Tax=Curtobacterium aurantiacum TaxID=3236919 RepID=UPI001BE12655|nr:ATP-binding protein [Curtobacterium flaccumfaciens]MBT1543758.1 ATP-binding protein [Curtobacterium flaccumfaciens pv. flaccumfaciens]